MEQEMVRIKKGVRPYGGRKVRVIERIEYPSGRKAVLVDVGRRAQFGVYVADVREYDESEVE